MAIEVEQACERQRRRTLLGQLDLCEVCGEDQFARRVELVQVPAQGGFENVQALLQNRILSNHSRHVQDLQAEIGLADIAQELAKAE